MSSREIVLWLDERWYAALERQLHDETLPEKLEGMLDELINKLIPQDEYEKISVEVFRERELRAAEREAERRFAVFRVTEHKERSCFLVEQPINILVAARSLRHYVRGESSAKDFRHYYAAAQELTPQEFTQFARERCEGSDRVVGAFDIDLDRGAFAELRGADMWHQFSVKSVCSAAYQADLRNDEKPLERLERFNEYLDGKELKPQAQPVTGMGMGQAMC